jgi:putative transposase
VADFTYVPAWSGMVYVAFVIDAYSRRILGWRAATSMKTALVLDALEQALWTRRRDGRGSLAGLIHHHDAGSRYTGISFTERLAAAGAVASVGRAGDAHDHALAEPVIGLFKTEHQAARTMADRGAGRARHLGARRLAQPPAAP